MSEFYSKETAVKTIWKILEGLGFPASINHELVKIVDAVFETAPAADVRPVVHGHWIDHQSGRWVYAKCSECSTVHDTPSPFCPNCGADMREDGTDG